MRHCGQSWSRRTLHSLKHSIGLMNSKTCCDYEFRFARASALIYLALYKNEARQYDIEIQRTQSILKLFSRSGEDYCIPRPLAADKALLRFALPSIS